ncbi:hypothetical protein [Abyssibacter sp.]|jgi:hypothetical protein|uniref:hypothetical protein n=1 Tax=Abyssibacter sp. TaxID=2320200 RepID=UPI0025BF522F|nr:hypothetical protein [Abyssibacter sp.]MCK5859706.1 hypothetical protein [Abyssibacter sp.]
MKAQITLLMSALMASGAALAASGNADAQGEISTDRRAADADMNLGAEGSKDRASSDYSSSYSYEGTKGEVKGSMSGKMSISMDEIVESPDASFAKLDRDGDGMISAGESTSSRPVLTQFDRVDEDGDRMLSSNEFDALVASFEDEMAE